MSFVTQNQQPLHGIGGWDNMNDEHPSVLRRDIDRIIDVVGTFIAWSVTELGEEAATKLLNQLSDDRFFRKDRSGAEETPK